MRGNCYAASEALYHILGGKAAGWKPMVVPYKGDNHWFLKHTSGMILDPSVEQFDRRPSKATYKKAKGCGFLTKKPSNRAKEVIQMLSWQFDEN